MAGIKTDALPGMGTPKIKELDAAAEDYVKKRDGRMSALKEEVTAKKTLTDLMHAHKLNAYEYQGEIHGGDDDGEPIERIVELKTTEKLKVKPKKGGEEEESEEPEEE